MRIRQDARSRYHFDDSLFSSSGHLVVDNIRAAHIFANAFNADRPTDEQISPAQLNAACVVHEIMHYAVDDFIGRQDPQLLARVLGEANRTIGHDDVEDSLGRFTEEFPDDEVAREGVTVTEFLDRTTNGTPNRQITLEEMLICWLTNENPAYTPFRELVRDDDIRSSTRYEAIVERFKSLDPGTPGGKAVSTLIDLLQEPVRRSPNSLRDQLAYMTKGQWGLTLPERLTGRAVVSDDLIAEEERAMAARAFAPGPPPPPPVPDFGEEPEYEQFSPDIDWMPRVVMIAKNAFVWLDQLSKKYDRSISRLDQIPEEEIEQLADWGFTALWLIGIWERSTASRVLKHRMGNPDAEASAYSIYDYVVSADLGGTGAVTGLRVVCQTHGIRLCSDMVPNHTGIDSRWIDEHPDWFVQVPYPPYPSYSYTSESLSNEPGVVLQVEDGYYDHSDAAVTFRRFDARSGDERFIYHGNDGTSMPWNDTAQLDFTKPEVREAVIQTILHVARQFPVIRFDAAMVLTRKHFRRLWYPPPGSGGGVPSRAEHGLSNAEFDRRMPVEFWREVVDTVAREVPDTLLLAEAFWLLEGYFVRTLGMHRVYNSAFMHMLKKEDNAKYREVIKNTLAFEPEILKRYVNFMSNPDEETALEQFGDGDKFFGVSTLLVTLPGLPMFGHGQVEGFGEKYGMEYRKAYHEERPRAHQVERFEREITPLMRRRYLFAEVANFFLFDFRHSTGTIDENVFAYTNRRAGENALVVYNNRFEGTEGRVLRSTRLEGPSNRITLAQALDLDQADGNMVTYTDVMSRSEHVVHAETFFSGGLDLRLSGYEHHVFVGFRVVEDDEDGTLAALADRLDGEGVDSLEEARTDIQLRPVADLLFDTLSDVFSVGDQTPIDSDKLADAAARLDMNAPELILAMEDLTQLVHGVTALADVGQRFKWNRSKRYKEAVGMIEENVVVGSPVFAALVATRCLQTLSDLGIKTGHRIVGPALERIGLVATGSEGNVETVISLARAFAGSVEGGSPDDVLSTILDESMFGEAFVINEYGGTTYYNKERFELGLDTAFCLDVLGIVAATQEAENGKEETATDEEDVARTIADRYDVVRTLRTAHELSEYNWTRLRKL